MKSVMKVVTYLVAIFMGIFDFAVIFALSGSIVGLATVIGWCSWSWLKVLGVCAGMMVIESYVKNAHLGLKLHSDILIEMENVLNEDDDDEDKED